MSFNTFKEIKIFHNWFKTHNDFNYYKTVSQGNLASDSWISIENNTIAVDTNTQKKLKLYKAETGGADKEIDFLVPIVCPMPEISILTTNQVEIKGLDNDVKYTLKNFNLVGSGTLFSPTNGVLEFGVSAGNHYLLKTEDGTEIVKFVTPERTSVIRTDVTIGVAGGYISSGYDSSAFYSIAISASTTENGTTDKDPGMRIDGDGKIAGAIRELNLGNYKPDSSGKFEFKNLSNSVALKISKLMIIKN